MIFGRRDPEPRRFVSRAEAWLESFPMTMTNKAFAVAACVLMGCSQQDSADSADGKARPLPFLSVGGTRIPYFRYDHARTGFEGGRTFFLHPMLEAQNSVMMLEGVQTDLSAIFAEDGIGTSGLVSLQGRTIRVEFLPISLPIGVVAGQQWDLTYARRTFTCRSRDAGEPSDGAGTLRVSCRSGEYELSFVFDRARGVREFQDFCGSAVCTFRLVDGQGLLSREILSFMKLPSI